MSRPLWSDLKAWARELKRDVVALWIAAHDQRTPLLAKLLAASVAAYALSPIDLIPDFIPVLGYLDDLLIVPLGIFLALRLVPPALMTEFRIAAEARSERPVSRAAAVVVVALWVAGVAAVALWAWPAKTS
ncbi:MAG TPA: YkvA family protein [Aurantimonas sp.]